MITTSTESGGVRVNIADLHGCTITHAAGLANFSGWHVPVW
jgi:hypothetical protein